MSNPLRRKYAVQAFTPGINPPIVGSRLHRCWTLRGAERLADKMSEYARDLGFKIRYRVIRLR